MLLLWFVCCRMAPTGFVIEYRPKVAHVEPTAAFLALAKMLRLIIHTGTLNGPNMFPAPNF